MAGGELDGRAAVQLAVTAFGGLDILGAGEA
jgi:hypothetical protein